MPSERNQLGYSIDVCKKVKTVCKYHLELSQVVSELDICRKAIINEPSEALLRAYVNLNIRERMLSSIIAVAEYKDLKIGVRNINIDLNNEMKTLLTKQIDKLPIDSIDWTSYVKAATNFTTAQSYGAKVESIYIRKKGYEKVNPSEEKGDVFDAKTNKYIEVKFTVVSHPAYQYDIVQIRQHHKIDAYHIIAFNQDTNQTEFYVLTKAEMSNELSFTGNKLAHGTNSSKSSLVNPEYAIRFKVDSELHKRWKKYSKPVDWK